MKTYFINMDAHIERRKFMERQFDELGVHAERFPAITEPMLVAAPPRHFDRRTLTQGELGCFESHRSLWAISAASAEPVLVLEDDVLLAGHFGRMIAWLSRNGVPSEVDLLRFVTTGDVGRYGAHAQLGGEFIRKVMQPQYCAAAYLVTPGAARWLLAQSSQPEIETPVDNFLFDPPTLVSLKVWQTIPGLAVPPERSAHAREAMPWHRSSLEKARRAADNIATHRPGGGLIDRLKYWTLLLRHFPASDLMAYCKPIHVPFEK